jgi:hypothetical protein
MALVCVPAWARIAATSVQNSARFGWSSSASASPTLTASSTRPIQAKRERQLDQPQDGQQVVVHQLGEPLGLAGQPLGQRQLELGVAAQLLGRVRDAVIAPGAARRRSTLSGSPNVGSCSIKDAPPIASQPF